MTIELKERIEKWQNDAVYNTRQVKIVKQLTNGEYILLLVEGADLNLEGESQPVVAQKLLQTRCQSPSSELNSKGDLHAFDIVADLIAKTYLDQASEVIKQWVDRLC